ncbi:MAG: exodeoxyribonuclease V subunit gamma, partial [Deltaproteobacteria bacterium]|nr:exodeoxyribonuclease V subunit gamma [Deltaproteobacteria bacterium]
MGTIVLYRSHRMEDLAGELVDNLDEAVPDDPAEPVLVVVGSRGMERWLRLEIATRTGICANVAFRFPQGVLADIADRVLGAAQAAGEADPWAPASLAWTVAELTGALAADPVMAPIRAYVAGEPAAPLGPRRWSIAREIADLLDAYAIERPDWVQAWRAGRAAHDPATEGPDAAWQRALYEAAASRLAERDPLLVRAQRACDAIRRGDARLVLGPVHVFGVSSLPPTYVDLFQQLAAAAALDVHLYVFAPSPKYWGDYVLARRRAPAGLLDRAAVQRLDAAAQDQHPLLASLGRVSRDMQEILLRHAEGAREPEVGSADVASGEPPTILATLQRDIVELHGASELRKLAASKEREIGAGDDSLQVRVSHGPTRQAEVLRDALLDLFDRHPALQPRDVLVMTPDVETYAPLVQAVLGEGLDRPREHASPPDRWGWIGAPRIAVEVADRSLRSVNAVADALLRALDLAAGRATASAVLDLLALFPVRARAGLEVDDLPLVQTWVREAGIRWAADAADRRHAQQPEDDQNTWLFGLRRLALGVVMEDDGSVVHLASGDDAVVPCEGGTSGASRDEDLAGGACLAFGRLAAFLRELFARCALLREPRKLDRWISDLRETVDAMTRVGASTAWLREQVADELADLGAQGRSYQGEVSLAVVRRVLEGCFDLPRQGDRPVTGAVTLCSLRPMRNVPFPVVCLLGMDDEIFPRRLAERGFDLTRRRPMPGDRDPRDEDRHLVLEAIMAARAHILIVYGGRDPQTNEERPPCGPVAELLDLVDLSFHTRDGSAPRAHVCVEHALQPFSRAAFPPVGERPFAGPSYDARACAIAGALAGARRGRIELFPAAGSLDPPEETELDLDDLVRCLRRPAKELLRRLRVHDVDRDVEIPDREPVELGALESWSIRDRLIGWALAEASLGADLAAAHADPTRATPRLRAEGALPLGTPGRVWLADTQAEIDYLVAHAAAQTALGGTGPRAIELELRAAQDGSRAVMLKGNVPAVTRDGVLLDIGASDPRNSPRRLIDAWVRLLALQAAQPREGRTALLAGMGTSGPTQVVLRAPADATGELARLLALRAEIVTRVVPLCERTSHALAARLHESAPVEDWTNADAAVLEAACSEAEKKWDPEWDPYDGAERKDPDNRAVWGDGAPYLDLEGRPCSAFVRRAQLLWGPILAALASGEDPPAAPEP